VGKATRHAKAKASHKSGLAKGKRVVKAQHCIVATGNGLRYLKVGTIGTQQLKLRDCDSINSIPNSTMHSLL